MTLGSKLINELARRHQLGMHFDYAGYRALQRVNDVSELAEFLQNRGFAKAPVSEDVTTLVDWFCDSSETKASQSLLTWIAFDPFGGIVAMPMWLLSRLANRS